MEEKSELRLFKRPVEGPSAHGIGVEPQGNESQMLKMVLKKKVVEILTGSL